MITGDIWQKVNDEILSEESVRKAVIAYVTREFELLEEGDFLICDASKNAIKYGKTSAKIIGKYYEKGVIIYSLENLHSKFLFTENVLIIGSANLSMNSAERLTETAIATKRKDEIANANAFFYNLTEEAKQVDDDYLKEILKIKVVSSENVRNKKSKARKIEFGNSIWLVSVTPLSERIYEKEKAQIEETKIKVSEIHEIQKDDISFIRFTGGKKTDRIRKNGKVGDLMIEISNNIDKTATIVREPTPILEVEYQEDCVRIYYNLSNLKELDYSDFVKQIEGKPIKKISKSSLREVTENELFYINEIMKKTR